MSTKYKNGTIWPQKAIFFGYTTAVNGTAIGWAGVGMIAMQTALDVDKKTVVREGSTILASYLLPASVALNWVTSAEKFYHFGRKTLGYGTKAYKYAKHFTSPLAAINYIGAQVITKTGLTEGMKFVCGVEECDDFYWEMPEYSDAD